MFKWRTKETSCDCRCSGYESNIILLDEPASALDPKHTKLVRRFIDRMVEKGMTVFVSTHDMDYAYEWADKVIIFKNGEQMALGKPKSFCTKRINRKL